MVVRRRRHIVRRRRPHHLRRRRLPFRVRRMRTRMQLRRGDKFFTRIYEQREHGVATGDPSTYGHLYTLNMLTNDDASQKTRFKRLASLYQQFKVHKVCVRIRPHHTVNNVAQAIGPYAVAPYYLPNKVNVDVNSTVPDNVIDYTMVAGLPNSKSLMNNQQTTLLFVPKLAKPLYPSGDYGASILGREFVPSNTVWISTQTLYPTSTSVGNNSLPKMYGFVFACQGSTVPVHYTIDIYYYVTFRGFKNSLFPV